MRTAGIRTYPMIGLLGGLWGAMYPVLGAIPLAVGGWHFGVKLTMVGMLVILSGAGVWLVTVAEI